LFETKLSGPDPKQNVAAKINMITLNTRIEDQFSLKVLVLGDFPLYDEHVELEPWTVDVTD